jgi:hypothetical protein
VTQLRVRVRHAVEIIHDELTKQNVSKAVDRERIEEEIRGYLRAPSRARSVVTLKPYGLFFRPDDSINPAHRDFAKQVEQRLRSLEHLLAENLRRQELQDDEDYPLWIDGSPIPQPVRLFADLRRSIADWIDAFHRVAITKRPKQGVAKSKFAHAKRHAAEVAVRLYKHHGLKLTTSHSPRNGLNLLSAAIYGERLLTTDQGFFQHACAAIKHQSGSRKKRPE